LVLGYIDPYYFLSGGMKLDVDAARRAMTDHIAQRLGTDEFRAASAVLQVTTERMAQAIEGITINQGIDPRNAVLIGGGGAAGLNVVAIARRLGFPLVILPEVGAALSAAGGLISPLSTEFAVTRPMTTTQFGFSACNRALADLRQRCAEFADQEHGALSSTVDLWAEARYPQQNWEIDVPLTTDYFDSESLERFQKDFHARHKEIFAISDPQSPVEVVSWHARVSCDLHAVALGRLHKRENIHHAPRGRDTYFAEYGHIKSTVVASEDLIPGRLILGPIIVESPLTTVVVDPGASVAILESGSLSIRPHADQPDVLEKLAHPRHRNDGVAL
jgi:N-methylhydantoinase A